jgi:hypothetical protein
MKKTLLISFSVFIFGVSFASNHTTLRQDNGKRIKAVLAKKGLELCGMYSILGAMESRNGQIAYRKHPDNAIVRSEYQQLLNEKGWEVFMEKYNLSKYDITEINWYGTKEKCR